MTASGYCYGVKLHKAVMLYCMLYTFQPIAIFLCAVKLSGIICRQ